MDSRGIVVRFPFRVRYFSFLRYIHTGSGTHPASHSVGTAGAFPGSKVAREWSWPFTSIHCLHGFLYRGNFSFIFIWCHVRTLNTRNCEWLELWPHLCAYISSSFRTLKGLSTLFCCICCTNTVLFWIFPTRCLHCFCVISYFHKQLVADVLDGFLRVGTEF
jgi:hypothetical protein